MYYIATSAVEQNFFIPESYCADHSVSQRSLDTVCEACLNSNLTRVAVKNRDTMLLNFRKQMSKREYRLKPSALDVESALQSWRQSDIDGDGYITQVELVEFLFYNGMSEDESRATARSFFKSHAHDELKKGQQLGMLSIQHFVNEWLEMQVFRVVRSIQSSWGPFKEQPKEKQNVERKARIRRYETDPYYNQVVSREELMGRLQDQLGEKIGLEMCNDCFNFHRKDTFESIFSLELEIWYFDLAARRRNERIHAAHNEKNNIVSHSHMNSITFADNESINVNNDTSMNESFELPDDAYILSKSFSVPLITNAFNTTSTLPLPTFKNQVKLFNANGKNHTATELEDDVSFHLVRANWKWLRSKQTCNIPVEAMYLIPSTQAELISDFTRYHTQDHSLHLYCCYLQNMLYSDEIDAIIKRKALVKAKLLTIDSDGFTVMAGFGICTEKRRWLELTFRFTFPRAIQTRREAKEQFQYLTDLVQTRREEYGAKVQNVTGGYNTELEMAPWMANDEELLSFYSGFFEDMEMEWDE